MFRLIVVVLAVVFGGLVAPPLAVSAGSDGVSATPDRPRYDVSLRSDGDGSRWIGRERVSFRNASSRALGEVYLRLWGNAVDGCGSGGAGSPVRVSGISGGTSGGLSVGCSVLRIKLPRALPRGARAELAFNVSITVPDRLDLFGREGAHRFLGNVLPILAVRDGQGWHLSPSTGSGEGYYSVAGDYRVELDHPAGLKIPASGRTSTRAGAVAGRAVTVSTGRGLRNFAWAAGPFRSAVTTTPGGVRVRAYWLAGTPAAQITRARDEAARAVDRFGRDYGRYPFGEVDLVLGDRLSPLGGMEYAGLVLDGTSEEGSAVVHEIAHQWWFGTVGSDAYASPWLSEGFAQYATAEFTDDDLSGCQDFEWPSETAALTNSMGYWKDHRAEFGRIIYTYSYCALEELEDVVGGAAFAGMLRRYAEENRYGISTTAKFKAAAQGAAGARDLGPFWREHRIR